MKMWFEINGLCSWSYDVIFDISCSISPITSSIIYTFYVIEKTLFSQFEFFCFRKVKKKKCRERFENKNKTSEDLVNWFKIINMDHSWLEDMLFLVLDKGWHFESC